MSSMTSIGNQAIVRERQKVKYQQLAEQMASHPTPWDEKHIQVVMHLDAAAGETPKLKDRSSPFKFNLVTLVLNEICLTKGHLSFGFS